MTTPTAAIEALDECRKAFEKWASHEIGYTRADLYFDHRGYCDNDAQENWVGWKAAWDACTTLKSAPEVVTVWQLEREYVEGRELPNLVRFFQWLYHVKLKKHPNGLKITGG